MRTCTVCKATSPDTALTCQNCGADLSIHSSTAKALQEMRDNDRVGRVRIIVADDTCPACKEMEGEYAKESTPDLPTAGCSHPLGCRCFYQPRLLEIYP